MDISDSKLIETETTMLIVLKSYFKPQNTIIMLLSSKETR